MKIMKKANGKKLNLNDLIDKNDLNIISKEEQTQIYGGMKWEGRRQSFNFIDTRSSEGYWLHFKLIHV